MGGVFKRWEFLLTGNPLVELGIANNIAKAGEILITPSAWKLIRNDSIAEPMEFELKDAIAQGGRLNQPEQTVLHRYFERKTCHPGSSGKFVAGIYPWSHHQSAYCRSKQLDRRTAPRHRPFYRSSRSRSNTELAEAQNLARLIQRAVYRYEGSINKINVDDKGITIVAALGLPPFSHEDDPARGVQAALMIRKELTKLNVRSTIGDHNRSHFLWIDRE